VIEVAKFEAEVCLVEVACIFHHRGEIMFPEGYSLGTIRQFHFDGGQRVLVELLVKCPSFCPCTANFAEPVWTRHIVYPIARGLERRQFHF